MAYRIEYAHEVADHLRTLTARQQAFALDAIDKQLAYQPTVVTRNRKPMRSNPVAMWVLRIGDLRVYYDVEDAPESVVYIRAIGTKRHNQVYIGNQGVQL